MSPQASTSVIVMGHSGMTTAWTVDPENPLVMYDIRSNHQAAHVVPLELWEAYEESKQRFDALRRALEQCPRVV